MIGPPLRKLSIRKLVQPALAGAVVGPALAAGEAPAALNVAETAGLGIAPGAPGAAGEMAGDMPGDIPGAPSAGEATVPGAAGEFIAPGTPGEVPIVGGGATLGWAGVVPAAGGGGGGGF